MEHHKQVALLERVGEHRRRGTTDAGAGATRFRPSLYIDAEQHRRERETLFRRLPIAVAYSAQLGAPGSFVTNDWAGPPIVVCRHQDGGLRAFLNLCRHRGTRLVQAKAGAVEKYFVCRYHAWSYDTAGALRVVPCAHQFDGLDQAETGLVELPVIERAGLVFVIPEPQAALDLDAYFGDFGRELDGFGLAEWELYATKLVHAKVNWKMMIEANQESYHIPFLHRETAAPRFTSQCSLLDTQGPHSRSALVRSHVPRAGLDGDRDQWRVLDHADVVYRLFPNTLVLLSEVAAHVLTAYPNGVDKAVIQGATLVPKGTVTTYPRPYYQTYWATIMEDIAVSEPIQAAAAYAGDLELWLGANEDLIRHFHDAVRATLDGERWG